jgi:TetR/AcrR family transcriptional repressor of nem operon
MGRPRNVLQKEILESSMNLFWKQGYDNTSYDEIIENTGTSRYGLYQQFGPKIKLFSSVLDYYMEHVIIIRMKPLLANNAGLSQIKQFFHDLINDIISTEDRPGCLLINSVVYEARHYPEINEQTSVILSRMQHIFRNVIIQGVKQGDIQKGAIEDGLDGILLAQLISINIMSPKTNAEDFLVFLLRGVDRLLRSYSTNHG